MIPQAAHGQPSQALRLAVLQGLNGQFASLTCRDDASGPALLAAAGALTTSRELAIDAGDLLGSAAVTRLVVERDVGGLADAIAATGIRALSVGHRDLAGPRATLVAGARALAARHVPYVLSNLRCEGAAMALCDVVIDAGDEPLLLDSPAGRVAVLAFLSPRVLSLLARDRSAGITLDALSESFGSAVARARAMGARWVVVTLDPTWHIELVEALSLLRGLSESSRPDVFIVNDLPEGMSSAQTDVAGVTLVASRRAQVVTVDLGASRVVQAGVLAEAPEAVRRFVSSTTRWLCDTHHRPLAGGQLVRPMELSDFGNLLVDVLRDRTLSEVGLVNRAAVRSPGIFPLRGAITALDVTAAMPFEDRVMVARMRGSVLSRLVKSAGVVDLIVRGITLRDGVVKVNGRPIDDGAYYSIVTTGFVADGGEGGFGEGAPTFGQFGSQSLQDVFMAWLSLPRASGVDITRAPSDPANHTRWRLRWTVDGSFAANSIRNNLAAVYTDAQLTRAEATTFRLDTELRADADHPSFTFDNSLRVQYGVARTVVGQDFTENLDLSSLRSAFTWRAWRGVTARFYHPLPYAETFVETEIDRPAGRGFHHLQLRPTGGARFELLPKLALNFGVGVDWEVNDSSRHAVAVLVARLQLQPRRLFSLGDRGTEVQGAFELSWRDPAGGDDMVARSNVKLTVPIFDLVSLTMAYDIFARATGANPWAIAFDANIGLRVTLDRAIQSFRM